MLSRFASRIPIVERLRVGFAAAGALTGALAPRLGAATTTPTQQQHQQAAALSSSANGSGGNDDPLVRFQSLFAEARDEIEYAREDAETTYFNESVQTAKQAVDVALEAWNEALNNQPDEAARSALVRGSGLKVEQLKAELQALDDIHA